MRNEAEEQKAYAMAARLVDYWRERGFLVTSRVEKVSLKASSSNSAKPHWLVRSDIVNGHPTKRIPE
jgi:hypothetical protein